MHNFHLGARRAGVDVATDVAGTGEKTTVVALQGGEAYIYACDAHPTTMNVTFSIHGRIRTQNQDATKGQKWSPQFLPAGTRSGE